MPSHITLYYCIASHTTRMPHNVTYAEIFMDCVASSVVRDRRRAIA